MIAVVFVVLGCKSRQPPRLGDWFMACQGCYICCGNTCV